MKQHQIEIIICTEAGYLESLSKLLISSLREFGGQFKEVPIFSYQPRKSLKISDETIAFFEQNNVEYIDLELNKDFTDYPLANKPLACAHREKNTEAEILIFLDSDVFFLNEPQEFIDFDDSDVILRPVDIKNIGAGNLEDENAIYWDHIYKLLNVQNRRKVSTTVTNENIWEYYNSGHIITLTKNSLFETWNDNFIKVMDTKIIPNDGKKFFLEQSILAATVSQMALKVKHFSKEYNYPIHLENKIINQDYIVDSFDSLVSIHYHKILKNNSHADYIAKKLEQTKQGRRINELIKQFDLELKQSE